MHIAIIGAGMAGLTCAVHLRAGGHEVSVFDKGRGPGGRMSTRRMEAGGVTHRFDHGAQYFTVRDEGFRAQVEAWERDGIAARWPAAGADAWVGTPGMNAPIKTMADEVAVRFGTRIEAISCGDNGWTLRGEAEFGPFDALVVAVPAEQVAPLLSSHKPDWSSLAARTESNPCWTVMAAFAEPLDITSDTLRDAGAFGWAARDSAKPGREAGERWVIQATPDWSREHLEDEQNEVLPALLSAFAQQTGCTLPNPLVQSAHRWRYARSGSADEGALWDDTTMLGLCGDWLVGPRVEAAWLSGAQLADRIIKV